MSLSQAIAHNGAAKSPQGPAPEQVQPVSPTFDPRVIRGESGHADLARRRLGEVHEMLSTLHQFEANVRSDSTLNADAKDLTIYNARRTAGMKVSDHLAGLVQHLDAAVTSAEKELHAGVSQSRYGAEIRAHLKGLTDAQRRMEVERIVGQGDLESLAAVLDAPMFLSGLTLDRAAAAKLRERAVRQRHPERAAHLDHLRQVSAAVLSAFHAGQEVDPGPNQAMERLREKARARTAAATAIGINS